MSNNFDSRKYCPISFKWPLFFEFLFKLREITTSALFFSHIIFRQLTFYVTILAKIGLAEKNWIPHFVPFSAEIIKIAFP